MDSKIVTQLPKKIAIVGTPNCGKTSLFNALTGLNQRVGNFSGVTVERKSATISQKNHSLTLVDLPGTNSLYPSSEDERITCQVLHDSNHPDHPDQVLVVADAMQLRRGIALCSQVIDLGFPTLLAINRVDLLEKNPKKVDFQRLSAKLGIPILPISATKKKGLGGLKRTLFQSLSRPAKQIMKLPAGFRPALEKVQEKLPDSEPYLSFQLLLSPQNFPWIDQQRIGEIQELAGIREETDQLISNELLIRYDFADELLKEVMYPAEDIQRNLSTQIDKIVTHRIWGYLIFFGILILIFQSIFSWSSYPMDAIDAWVEGIKSSLDSRLPEGWGKELLLEGILTGFGGIIIFIPQIAFLFFFVAVMEESGYMARVVFLMDRIMRPFGFSGKSIIPLMGGMACAIPSIMMTRNIPNKYERLITIMVTPLMSCSARIPVYTLLIAMFIPANRIMGLDQRGLFMTGLYILGFVMALLVAWMFKKILQYKSDGVFIMEMPDYHSPQWKNIGLTVYQRVKDFLFGAGKIILAISILLWLLVSYGPSQKMDTIDRTYTDQLSKLTPDSEESAALEQEWQTTRLESSYAAGLGKFIEPVIKPLGYDWKIGISLITSFAAREIFVGTMSIIYNQEDPGNAADADGELQARKSLIERLQSEMDPRTGDRIYTPATVASLLIFYVFAMQCMSTLAVTKREAGWFWAIIMLVYLTLLAYGAAWLTYTLFNL